MIGFLAGCIFGGTMGILIACLCVSSGQADQILERSNEYYGNEAADLVEGLTAYRIRQMCIEKQIPSIMAGKKYLINKEHLLRYLRNETV